MRNAFAALLLAASAVLSSGCLFSHGQLDLLGTGTAFDETQERFSRLVRWGHWEMAIPLVAEDQREHFAEVMRQLDDVKFTDWENINVEVAAGFDTARAEVRLEGYRESTLRTAEAVMVQEWERIQGLESEWVVRPDLEPLRVAFRGGRDAVPAAAAAR
jgi:hypothetical protein